MNKFYITTTLPYVNAEPHIGFALEIVEADVIARFKRAQGFDVVFNTGTDEHGLKIYRRAREEKKDPQAYVDEYAKKFDALKDALNLSYTDFIRTSDEAHKKAAQEFWKLCEKNGDIYKKKYSIKYCVGCELEKTESELFEGKCPLHPKQELELIDEENYFFRFSKYQEKLLELYRSQSDFVVPESRLHEIKKFVEQGLQDFSISRLKEKLPWGVPVPGDEDHVMYVWFDALVNYISTLGWPSSVPLRETPAGKSSPTDDKSNKFKDFWISGTPVQVAGKDNLRQQAAIWQAMLFSAGIPNTHQIFIHGFITHDGKKMSKSLGNVVDPIALVQKYGTDAVRYFLLIGFHAYEDGDFTVKRFEEIYNAELANGIGNFVQRVTTLAEKAKITRQDLSDKSLENAIVDNISLKALFRDVEFTIKSDFAKYEFWHSLVMLQQLVAAGDKYLNDTQAWTLKGDKQREVLGNLVYITLELAKHLHIFLPQTSENILSRFGLTIDDLRSQMQKPLKIGKKEPLFQRLS